MTIIRLLLEGSKPTQQAFDPSNPTNLTGYSFPVLENFSGDVSGNCPNCGSTEFQSVDAQPPHGQKLICSDCGRFIKWLPKTKNKAAHQELKARLESLKGKATGWDSAFVDSLIQKIRISERDGKVFKISPRQLECLEKIENKFPKNNSSGVQGGS